MLAWLGSVLNRFSRRWVPDPFVLALALTALVLVIGGARMLAGPGSVQGSFAELAIGWIDGVASTGGLAFALQMCLVLVTGHAMALSPPVQRAIVAIAKLPSSAGAAAALVAFVACVSALIHWGLGAIVGALLAREMARHAKRRGLALHYPVMGAAAYAGMAVWHGGLSGSAPLKVASGDGAQWTGGLSLYDILLSPTNLVVTGSLVLLIPLLFWALVPTDASLYQSIEIEDIEVDALEGEGACDSPVARLQESVWPGRLIGALGLGLVGSAVFTGVRALDINTVNILFFFVGLLLQGSLRRYVAAITSGAKGAGAIIVQFPLYFGILGLMQVSGLVTAMSEALVSVSSKSSFPLFGYVSAGLVNLFVPSGGGQWAVQRDILLGAGASHAVDPALTVLAFSYGDAWTNMLQPFWALPLLGIMGLKAKDIIGYTAMVFVLMAVVVPLGMWVAM